MSNVSNVNKLCSTANETNAYWNNEANPPDQSVATAGLLPAFLAYSIGGGIASVFNILCILIFLTKKELRKKYLLFAALAFGNLLNTLFCLIAGATRRKMIYANEFLQTYSVFSCLKQPGTHLQLLGGQLPALVLLTIALQWLFAVYAPIFYRAHFSMRTRILLVLVCFVTVLASYLLGILSSYWNREFCVNSFCSPTAAFGYPYGNYHTITIILLPITSLILNIIAYIGAMQFGVEGSMRKELKMIVVALSITGIDVLLIAIPNVLLLSSSNNLITMDPPTLAYLYVLFCCNSATDLFVYTVLKREFRNHLFNFFSFGVLKKYWNKIPRASANRLIQNGEAVDSRPSLQPPVQRAITPAV